MFELPTTVEHYQKLQAEFNRRLYSLYDDAKEIVEQRAAQRDVQRPVWERVPFPIGSLCEVTKRLERIKAQVNRGEKCMVPEAWAQTREDILDAVNYLCFMAVYGDMLHDEMFPVDPGHMDKLGEPPEECAGDTKLSRPSPDTAKVRKPTTEEVEALETQIKAKMQQQQAEGNGEEPASTAKDVHIHDATGDVHIHTAGRQSFLQQAERLREIALETAREGNEA